MKSEIPQTFYLPTEAVPFDEAWSIPSGSRAMAQVGVVAALFIAAGAAWVQGAAAQTTAARTFRVFVRGADTGIEEVTVLETADGWTLRGSGKLRAPVNLSMDLLGGALRSHVETDRAHDQSHREREEVERPHHVPGHDRVE